MCVRVCFCRCGCKYLTYLDSWFCSVVVRTRKVSCVFGYLNLCMYIRIGLCVRIYWFVDMTPDIMSSPKQSAPVHFLYLTVKISKTDKTVS